ncbi:MAG: hypothetical protein ACP5J8_00595 [Minisyncoccia bacterium]
MHYETPQFIREEIKFFGIITFTQLGILIGIGGIVFILLHSPIPKFISFILITIIVLVGLLITFLEIGGIKVYRLIPDIIRHFFLPKHYLWKKEKTVNFPQPIKQPNNNFQLKQIQITKKKLDEETLKKISQILDQ